MMNFIVGCVRVCGVRMRGDLYERLPVYMPAGVSALASAPQAICGNHSVGQSRRRE